MSDRIYNETYYEWVWEPIDQHGDIIDPCFTDSYASALAESDGYQSIYPDAAKCDIGLVWHLGNDSEGEIDRGYAYVIQGKLEPEFHMAGMPSGKTVPRRFHNEVKKHIDH